MKILDSRKERVDRKQVKELEEYTAFFLNEEVKAQELSHLDKLLKELHLRI